MVIGWMNPACQGVGVSARGGGPGVFLLDAKLGIFRTFLFFSVRADRLSAYALEYEAWKKNIVQTPEP